MEQKFNVGNVVVLKSGGPRMTISNDKTGTDLASGSFFNGRYDCQWFDEDKIQKSRFRQEALEMAK